MSKKTVVAYATKLGSTREVAQTIGDTLSKQGMEVDVKVIQDITSLDGYSTIIIGSAIRMGRWLPEAVDFAKQHQQLLKEAKTAIFSVHILNSDDTPESAKEREAYTKEINDIITPQSEAFFTGKVDPAKLGFKERLLFKMVKSPEGDFRDWDVIRSWANQLVS